MKKRQLKKKKTSKRIKRNEIIKNKIRTLVLESKNMEKVSQNEQSNEDAAYWSGKAAGLYEALCLINNGHF